MTDPACRPRSTPIRERQLGRPSNHQCSRRTRPRSEPSRRAGEPERAHREAKRDIRRRERARIPHCDPSMLGEPRRVPCRCRGPLCRAARAQPTDANRQTKDRRGQQFPAHPLVRGGGLWCRPPPTSPALSVAPRRSPREATGPCRDHRFPSRAISAIPMPARADRSSGRVEQ